MAQVELIIAEDGSASIELALDPTETAALVSEAARAQAVEAPAATPTPPAEPAATAPSTTAEPAAPSEPTPTGPDTLTPTGSPAVRPDGDPSPGASEPGSSAGETIPPAPTG